MTLFNKCLLYPSRTPSVTITLKQLIRWNVISLEIDFIFPTTKPASSGDEQLLMISVHFVRVYAVTPFQQRADGIIIMHIISKIGYRQNMRLLYSRDCRCTKVELRGMYCYFSCCFWDFWQLLIIHKFAVAQS